MMALRPWERNGQLPWGQAKQAHAGWVFAGFERLFPARPTQVQEFLKVKDAQAVVTNRDVALVVGNHHMLGAGASGILQDFRDATSAGCR